MSQTDEKSLDAILESAKKDLAKITEKEFTAKLLPILTNTGESANLEAWLDTAGSWQRSIAVTDPTGKDVLFIVPALIGGTGKPVLQRGDNSAYELIENAQRKMRVVPRAGDEMLINGLRERVSIDGDRAEAIKVWNYIYRRYGYTDLLMPEAHSEDEVVDNGSNSAFSGYDEA
jgi:hypothetical protein